MDSLKQRLRKDILNKARISPEVVDSELDGILETSPFKDKLNKYVYGDTYDGYYEYTLRKMEEKLLDYAKYAFSKICFDLGVELKPKMDDGALYISLSSNGKEIRLAYIDEDS